MRLFLDTEFNSFGGELMSMALVPEEPYYRSFYYVLPLPLRIDPWVFQHVVPVLNASPVSREFFLNELREYLKRFHNPTICVDYYVDLKYFFQCFDGVDYPSSFNYACKTEIQLIDQLSSRVPHNALSDAEALQIQWGY